MNLDFNINFAFAGEKYSLSKSDSSEHLVKIKGVNYAVLGPEKNIDEVCRLLKTLSLETISSSYDLIDRLSKVENISSVFLENISTIGEERFGSVKGKAKEVEDLPSFTSRPILKRRGSFQTDQMDWSKKIIEAEDLKQKSGHMWNCEKRTPDNYSDGYVYTFKIKAPYDDSDQNIPNYEDITANVDQKIEEIFPAAELSIDGAYYFFKGFNEDQTKLLQYLGYSCDLNSAEINLPDRETLIARWEKLRESDPKLPRLDIASSEGTADDLAFVEAFFSHGALLSTGIEFVHDSIFHIIPAIISASEGNISPEDLQEKERKRELAHVIIGAYRKLMIAKSEIEKGSIKLTPSDKKKLLSKIALAQAALGAVTDGAASELKETGLQAKEFLEGKLMADNWKDYLGKRFSYEGLVLETLEAVWKEISQIEQSYNDMRKGNGL